MKANKYMAILVASLAVSLSGAAKADPNVPGSIPGQYILAGWYDFDDGLLSENPDKKFGPQITGAIDKGVSSAQGLPGGAAAGSSDGFYGLTWPTAIPTSYAQDGRLNINPGSAVIFSITNSSPSAIPVSSLLFDMGRTENAGTNETTYGLVDYRYGSSGSWLPVYSTLPSQDGILGLSNGTDYSDFGVPLSPLLISISSNTNPTVQFRFTGAGPFSTGGELKLDNILFTTTAIPEPGSMLALGCFLGSGLLIRRNRRSVA